MRFDEGVGGENFFGKIVVYNNLADNDQVAECLKLQKDLKRLGYELPLGQILVDRGHLDRGTVTDILEMQRKRHKGNLPAEIKDLQIKLPKDKNKDKKKINFGQLAVSNKVLAQEKIDTCLEIQALLKKHGIRKKIGEIVVEKGYLHQTTVEAILNVQSSQEGNRLFYLLIVVAVMAVMAVPAMLYFSMDTDVDLVHQEKSSSSSTKDKGHSYLLRDKDSPGEDVVEKPEKGPGSEKDEVVREKPAAPDRKPLPGEDKLFPELYGD